MNYIRTNKYMCKMSFMIVCRALQFPPEAWLRISLDHASITWVTIRPSGRVSIRRLGDSGFIPAKEVTAS